MDVQQVRAAALARVQGRQRPPEFKTVGRNLDGSDIRMQVGGDAGEILGPLTASQWIDDRLIRVPGNRGPWVPVLYEIAEAARTGEIPAVAAVTLARQLTEHDQFRLFVVLADWSSRAELRDASALMRAVLAEWRRRGLADHQPDDPEEVTVRDVNAADMAAAETRRRASRGW